ncbi:DUF6348 family protein, partial [Pseudomonas aeruginosa]
DERQLQEAFAGIGSGEDGLQDALRNFASNSFHVLLSALWGQAEVADMHLETPLADLPGLHHHLVLLGL